MVSEMMDLNQQKEQFSRAFVHAVASVAGFNTYRPEVDDDSIDVGIAARRSALTPGAPRVELQLKCTSRPALAVEEAHLAFSLKRKNYDDLRAKTSVPRLLVVMCVPETSDAWLIAEDDRAILRHAAYWVSLRDRPETPNETAVTVHVPRVQRFDPPALVALMSRLQTAGDP
jgi:hypothetical protein